MRVAIQRILDALRFLASRREHLAFILRSSQRILLPLHRGIAARPDQLDVGVAVLPRVRRCISRGPNLRSPSPLTRQIFLRFGHLRWQGPWRVVSYELKFQDGGE